jgi:hypothetical protein
VTARSTGSRSWLALRDAAGRLLAADRPTAISAATATAARRLVAAIDADVVAARDGATQAEAAAALGVDVTALRRRRMLGPRTT